MRLSRLASALAFVAVLAVGLIGAPRSSLADQNTCVTPGPPLTMTGLATFINNCTATIGSTYSGTAPPAVFAGGTAKPYQFWFDTSTTPGVLRINDGTSWVSMGSLDATAHVFSISPTSVPTSISGASYTFADVDRGTTKIFTNTSAAIALPQAGAASQFATGWFVDVKYTGTGTGTITPTTSTIDGGATFTLTPGRAVRIVSDGTNYHSEFKPGTPTTAVLGGVFSKAAVSSNWLRSLGTDGNFTASQPAASDLTNGTTGSGALVLATGAAISTPTITGGTLAAITGLGLRSSGSGAFDLTLANSENLTAGRTLTLTLNDASRTINLGGNVTTAGALTTVGANPLTLTTTGSTNVTLPTTGTLATLAGAEALTNKTVNGLTITSTTGTLTIASGKTFVASNSLTLTGTDGNSFAFPSGSDTVVTLGATQTLTAKTLTSPIVNTPTIAGGTHTAITSLGIRSTGAAFDLTFATSEALTAGRTLSLVVNDAARTINLGGNLTLAAAFATSGANSLTLTTTGSTNVTLPTSGTLVNSAVTTLSSLASVGTITTGVWNATKIALLYGGTNADLSATGGTSQVLMQTSTGAAITVAQLAASNLSNGTSGSGAVCLVTNCVLVTPTLGVAAATSINKVAITAPATSATITIADGKTFTANNSLTLSGTDGKALVLTNGLTVTTNDGTLAFGAASKTLTVNKSIALDGTDGTTWTGPSTSATLARTDAGQTFTGTNTFSTPIALGSGGSGQATAAAARGASGFNIDACTSTGDANYTVLSTDRCVYHTALSAARTDTLPAASAFNPGQIIVINDFRGVAGATNTITLQRAGSDTINGSSTAVAVNTQYGWATYMSDGSSRWTFQAGSGGGGGGGVSAVSCDNGLSCPNVGNTISSSGTIKGGVAHNFLLPL